MQASLKHIKESLKGLYSRAEIDSLARIIMETLTGLSIPMIVSDKSKKITPNQASRIEEIVYRLQQSEPIQYILGETEFYALKFIVDENVLIPRPETEELVELIINENKHKNELKILDIGTGSGCIAISLKKHLKDANISAWDVSGRAIEVAKQNAQNNDVEINFERIDVLKDFPDNRKYDIIVSNPPYVLDSEKLQMESNVLDHEPHLALFVSDDNALLFYNRIADIATTMLTKGGKLYFEINAAKGQEVVDMLANKGFSDIELIKDMAGKNRMTSAKR